LTKRQREPIFSLYIKFTKILHPKNIHYNDKEKQKHDVTQSVDAAGEAGCVASVYQVVMGLAGEDDHLSPSSALIIVIIIYMAATVVQIAVLVLFLALPLLLPTLQLL
jgi:hypothetical protein